VKVLGRVGGEQLETPVDREAEAEGIEQRRLAAAEAKNRELGVARRLTSRELRDAFVWTEILGPPVAFRE
jgi:hypothetical protein